jgi:signal transduction histidine kinase
MQSLLKSVLNPSYGMNMQGMNNTNFGTPIANQYSYIVNPSGMVIASYDSTMIGKDFSNLGNIKEYIKGIKDTATSNYNSENLSNSGYFNNYKKINSYTNYTTLSGYGNWGVVTESPKSSVYSPIIRFALINTIIVLIAAILIIVIANYTSKLIINPIKKLLNAMDQIGEGNYDIDLNTDRKDEFGKLYTSLVNLSQSVKTLLSTTNEQSGELQAIIDNNRSPILSLDNDGGILISNKPALALLELTENDIHGKKVEEILALKVGEVKTNMNLEGLLDGKYFLENQIFMSPTNQKHIVDISITKLPKSDLIITRYVLTFTDKTKSIELDEMKLDFVSMAAHELRTPLTAIQGYLELMLFGDNANGYNESTRRYIDQARVSSKELSELITKLLNVSRIEHGNLKFSWDKVDIAERVKEAVESLQFSAKEKKVTLSLKGNVENEFIVADRYSIQEVIDNLIDNAIKYNKENGEVNVSIEDDGSNYTIIISDTGIGVPKNAIPYLFTKFYRVHGGLESGSTGTGLGLYLAKQIVESHRGTVSVESEIDKGTTFTITLPHYSETLFKTLAGTNNNNTKETNNAWNTKNINR